MEGKEIIINSQNFLDFIKNPLFNNLKLGEKISQVLEYIKDEKYNEIKNKYFHLISIGNVELTFINEKLQKLHFEVNKPILKKYNFQIIDFNLVKEIITNSEIKIDEIIENEFIGFEKVKFYFEDSKLIDLYFELNPTTT
jgi:hypothetical protein